MKNREQIEAALETVSRSVDVALKLRDISMACRLREMGAVLEWVLDHDSLVAKSFGAMVGSIGNTLEDVENCRGK